MPVLVTRIANLLVFLAVPVMAGGKIWDEASDWRTDDPMAPVVRSVCVWFPAVAGYASSPQYSILGVFRRELARKGIGAR
jgi:NADH:ubiquinone oxidoreductase subunit H